MYYKKCAYCHELFSSRRKDGGGLSIKQFSGIKTCSLECSRKNSPYEHIFKCVKGVCYFTISNGTTFSFSERHLKEVSKYYWYSDSSGYAMSDKNRKKIRLHSFVVGPIKKGYNVDHINRDKTDNTDENLRVVTHQENIRNSKLNIRNTSGISGVYPVGKKWMAMIKLDGRDVRLGRFTTKLEAIQARIDGEKKYWGKVYSVV